MRALDYRNETFADLQNRISGQREAVLAAWRAHGPCTTETLADRSGLSILRLRPRTTELYQMGFVVLAEPGAEASTKGAVYRAATTEETQAHFRQLQALATQPQRELAL